MARKLPLLLVLLASLVTAAIHAQSVRITPAWPSSGVGVTIEIFGISEDSCVPAVTEVRIRSANVWVIELTTPSPGACLAVLTPWHEAVQITFSAGIHRIIVEIDGEPIYFADIPVRDSESPYSVTPNVVPITGGTEIFITGPFGTCPIAPPCPDVRAWVDGEPVPSVREIDANTIAVRVLPHDAGPALLEVGLRDGATRVAIPGALVYNDPETHPEPSAYTPVFFPVLFEGPGGHGSLWTTTGKIFHAGNFPLDPVTRERLTPCLAGTDPCPPQIPAGATLEISPRTVSPYPSGLLLYVPRAGVEDLHYALRARDLSRQAETWGTEIPVVREDELRTGTIELLDVPLDERFRRTLRIYALPEAEGLEVNVRAIDADGEVVSHQRVTLGTFTRCIAPCFIPEAAYAELSLLESPPGGSGPDSVVRVEVAPSIPAERFWAFVSVTNNETQHVTTITPQ